MARHIVPDNLVDPELLPIWRELNSSVFNGSLNEPVSLCYKYDLHKMGGLCQYISYSSDDVRIAIRGQLKGAANEIRQIMAHEMTHQFCWKEWRRMNSSFKSNYKNFVTDNSIFFKYWLTWVAAKLGTTYSDLASYDTKYVDTENNQLSQPAYEAIQFARSALDLFDEVE